MRPLRVRTRPVSGRSVNQFRHAAERAGAGCAEFPLGGAAVDVGIVEGCGVCPRGPNIDAEIPTIVLNRTYSPLKSYVQARAVELTDEGKEKAREHYAVGVGIALLVLDEEARKAAEKAGKPLDEAALHAGQRAAARAVLSVLPAYDRLAKELED